MKNDAVVVNMREALQILEFNDLAVTALAIQAAVGLDMTVALAVVGTIPDNLVEDFENSAKLLGSCDNGLRAFGIDPSLTYN